VSQSIERAIEVLMAVGESPKNPAEISRHLDVHRSTALRIMDVLQEQKLLRRLPDGRYSIGPGLVSLAHRALDQFDIARIARPRLIELSELHDQTVHLAELQNRQIVYIDKIEPKRSVRLASRVGEAVCLHTASVAKSILAFMSLQDRNNLLSDHTFERFNAATLASRSELEEELEEVRRRGWATDAGEQEDYINAIGAPIRDATGNVVAALSVIELKAITDLEHMRSTVLEPLLRTATLISQDLGWEEPVPSTAQLKETHAS
jgi:DNA-binding IclR family transcriptional regulator